MSTELHPLDAGLLEVGVPISGLAFPPAGWSILKTWGLGYALQDRTGLRLLIDCEQKEDDRFWVHISVSRAARLPTHGEMCAIKTAFLGDRYAYAVYPPTSEYVNIHAFCLHLWALIDNGKGQALPEFSGVIAGVKTI